MSVCRTLLAACVLVCVSSCKEKPPQTQPSSSATSPPAQGGPVEAGAAGASQPASPTDSSLSVAQYLELGLPRVDRPWVASDYQDAAKVLLSLAQKDVSQLPHYRSAKSAAVLERLCNLESLRLVRDRSAPLERRFDEGLLLLATSNAIGKTYAKAQENDRRFASDTARVYCFVLHCVASLADLSIEYRATLDPNKPGDQARIEKIKSNAGIAPTMALAVLQVLCEVETYDSESRRLLANSLADTYSALARDLPSAARRLLDGKVAQQSKVEVDDQIKAALARALRQQMANVETPMTNE